MTAITRPTIAETVPTQAFIAGVWSTPSSTFEVRNPYNNDLVARVANCGPEDAKAALESAVTAFATWRQTSGFERAVILKKWAELIRAHELEIGRTMTLEMGKPISEGRGESIYCAAAIEWNAEEATRVAGEVVPSRFAHKRAFSRLEPVGVVYGITPWNFPGAMIARKVAPALAAGCVFILKPAEQSPLTALYMAKLWEEAGGPIGTFQVIPTLDPIPVSKVLIDDARVKKLTFTGSTDVGRLLYGQSAKTLKRVSLELGGHAPFIVFDDADAKSAAAVVAASKFRNAGQQCVATNRVYVQEGIKAEFLEHFAREAQAIKTGNPLESTTSLGPLVDLAGLEKVRDHVADAVSKGARIVTGGGTLEGLFYAPTILDGITPDMKIVSEETFGPVAPVIGFSSADEAIALANDTEYGLAAYVWTRDITRAFKVAESLEYGIVGVNDGVPSAMAPQAPFGGMKNSGVGREGGRWGLEAFLEVKYISIGLP